MMSIRISKVSKLFCVAGAATLLVLTTTPAQAQQFSGFRNSRVGTLGDLSSIKLRPLIRPLPGLSFSTLGLFGDAEAFRPFEAPDLFIFAIPNFSGAGLDFNGVTFDEYLNLVANSYEVSDRDIYKNAFLFNNSYSVANNRNFFNFYDDLTGVFDLFLTDRQAFFDANPQLTANDRIRFTLDPSALPSDLNDAAFNRIHAGDFLAGGGFFPLSGDPVTPTNPEDVPPPFEPIDPVFTTPLIPKTAGAGDSDTNTDTSSAGELAGIIGDSTGLTLDDTTGLAAVPASASQAAAAPAASVSVVPEPATLGLLAVGSLALFGRSRRR